MQIATSWTTNISRDAVTETFERLVKELGTTPSLLVAACSSTFDIETVAATLHTLAPDTPVHGSTSCMGVMTQDGLHSESGNGLSLMGIYDPDGSYGVGSAIIEDDPFASAQHAVNTALLASDRPGEIPAMIWMSAAPGHEEQLIEGISSIIGKDVPISGGSSADNEIKGEWRQFTNQTVYENAIVLTVLFPSTGVMFAFHNGYEATDLSGTATKVCDPYDRDLQTNEGRMLKEIDHKPAAEVYNSWCDGLINDSIDKGGNILEQATLTPLGRVAGYIGDVPYYLLSHPDAVTEDNALTFFTDLHVNDEVVLMHGTVDSLISRAGRVAASALETYSTSTEDVAGALIVYCAGCMLEVQDRLDEVVDDLCKTLPDVPFLGAFTFGEQGCFLGGNNRHGNLMISVLLFRK